MSYSLPRIQLFCASLLTLILRTSPGSAYKSSLPVKIKRNRSVFVFHCLSSTWNILLSMFDFQFECQAENYPEKRSEEDFVLLSNVNTSEVKR